MVQLEAWSWLGSHDRWQRRHKEPGPQSQMARGCPGLWVPSIWGSLAKAGPPRIVLIKYIFQKRCGVSVGVGALGALAVGLGSRWASFIQ